MSDLDALHDLAGRIRPPEFDDLVAVARTRTRHSTLGAALAVAAVVVVVVGMAGGVLSGGLRTEGPARGSSPSLVGGWTPERIRAEGLPGDMVAVEGSGLVARLYLVCDGPGCTSDGGGRSEDKHRALEVTQSGRSALFEVSGIGSQGPWITVFDDDSVLVEDTAPDGVWPDGPARFRLLQADGTAVSLRLSEDPVRATSGMTTVVIDDFRRHGAGMGGGEKVYLVDQRARTLRPQDLATGP